MIERRVAVGAVVAAVGGRGGAAVTARLVLVEIHPEGTAVGEGRRSSATRLRDCARTRRVAVAATSCLDRLI